MTENGTTPDALTRAALGSRRAALQAELLAAMQRVEQLRGALVLLDDLLAAAATDPTAVDGP